MLIMLVKWYSGHIFNQLWDRNELKEEVDITDAAHKAYYKENRAHNAFCSEHDELAKVLNIEGEQLQKFLSDSFCPLLNLFTNCYISNVDLDQALNKIRDIEIGTKD